MAVSSSSVTTSSFFGLHRCVIGAAALVVCVLFCLPTTTKAMPMKAMIEEAMMQAREDHHRARRDVVTRTACARPDNLAAMFEQINSGLGNAQFLNNLHDNSSISIPAGVVPQDVDTDPNESKTCPSTLTTDTSAPLAHRSLCPYYFKTKVLPEGYYPTSLKNAYCKCKRCVQNNVHTCEAVKVSIAVLKPVGCFQGMQKFEEEIFDVNTGCVCATAGTTTTPPPTTTSPWWVE